MRMSVTVDGAQRKYVFGILRAIPKTEIDREYFKTPERYTFKIRSQYTIEKIKFFLQNAETPVDAVVESLDVMDKINNYLEEQK